MALFICSSMRSICFLLLCSSKIPAIFWDRSKWWKVILYLNFAINLDIAENILYINASRIRERPWSWSMVDLESLLIDMIMRFFLLCFLVLLITSDPLSANAKYIASNYILCTPNLSFFGEGRTFLILWVSSEWLYHAIYPEGEASASITMLCSRNYFFQEGRNYK